MSKGKVLMAMSGGIDSTMSAILLQEQGYELVGVTYRAWDSMKESCIAKEKGCCTIDAIMEAKRMAQSLGFEHHIIDFRENFRELVIQNFIDEYMNGRTPNPCVLCNATIKWGKLLEVADQFGCDYIATGHYAQIKEENGHRYLCAAADTHKDQTYFLWRIKEDDLARTIFPLGGYTKLQIRQMAKDRGYEKLSTKTESQEICFIPNDDYRDFLKNNVEDFDQKCVPGHFVDMQGRKIGTHQGFQNYTIGQRKGLRVAYGEPRYVAGINAKKNIVKLGERDDLLSSTLHAMDCQFTDLEALQKNPQVYARIRYKSPATLATVETDGKKMKLTFEEPVWGVTPGQSVVLYQDGKVIGGGVVKK